jgi:hypothetical protein
MPDTGNGDGWVTLGAFLALWCLPKVRRKEEETTDPGSGSQFVVSPGGMLANRWTVINWHGHPAWTRWMPWLKVGRADDAGGPK